MTYSLLNISQAPSYELLKRNGFSDIDVIAYYNSDIETRKIMFNQIKTKSLKETSTSENNFENNTNKNVSIKEVKDMAEFYMQLDWAYKGKTFNLNKLGWKFEFNEVKSTLGICSHRRKTIYLSKWYIRHNTREMKMWVNTMIHEIAHAINNQLGVTDTINNGVISLYLLVVTEIEQVMMQNLLTY